jgi:hypothetical protein
MKFNINHDVRVKLSYSGREALRRQHEELKRTIPKLPDFKEMATDDEGYTKFQMWDLMSTLGSLCTLGKPSPFDTEILIDIPTDHNRENDMTERTITQNELRDSLENLGIVSDDGINDIIEAAFPPIFKPKKGQIIVVSDFRDFSNSKIRMFSHMNVNSGKYECFMGGDLDETNTNTWIHAKPQTPTQKGEG